MGSSSDNTDSPPPDIGPPQPKPGVSALGVTGNLFNATKTPIPAGTLVDLGGGKAAVINTALYEACLKLGPVPLTVPIKPGGLSIGIDPGVGGDDYTSGVLCTPLKDGTISVKSCWGGNSFKFAQSVLDELAKHMMPAADLIKAYEALPDENAVAADFAALYQNTWGKPWKSDEYKKEMFGDWTSQPLNQFKPTPPTKQKPDNEWAPLHYAELASFIIEEVYPYSDWSPEGLKIRVCEAIRGKTTMAAQQKLAKEFKLRHEIERIEQIAKAADAWLAAHPDPTPAPKYYTRALDFPADYEDLNDGTYEDAVEAPCGQVPG